MDIKRKGIFSVIVCFIFVLGCFSTLASITTDKGSTNTHVFLNIFGHCDDLHIKYNKFLTEGSIDIVEYEGAMVFEYEIIEGYELYLGGLFPQGSSLEITVQSQEDGVLFPVTYYWTVGGVPASPDIPVKFLHKPFYRKDGFFRLDEFVDKPIDDVRVEVTRTQNVKGGKDGIGVLVSEYEGGTIITYYGYAEDIYDKAKFWVIVDPPGIIIDEIIELKYNVEFKGLFGVSVSVLNVGETIENLYWSIDLSGLLLIGKHTEGTINSFPTNATEVLKTGLVFGFGPSIVTATIGDGSINASCFILGPLVLNIQQPPS